MLRKAVLYHLSSGLLESAKAVEEADLPEPGPGLGLLVLDLDAPTPAYVVEGQPYQSAEDLPEAQAAPERARLLALARDEAKTLIDRQAEERRGLIVTPGTGQMAVYQAKEAEARAYVIDSAPDPANYPFLSAEAAAMGKTMAVQAGIILAMATAWRSYGAAIEGVRLGAKLAVDAAADQAAIAAVLANLTWPSLPTGA